MKVFIKPFARLFYYLGGTTTGELGCFIFISIYLSLLFLAYIIYFILLWLTPSLSAYGFITPFAYISLFCVIILYLLGIIGFFRGEEKQKDTYEQENLQKILHDNRRQYVDKYKENKKEELNEQTEKGNLKLKELPYSSYLKTEHWQNLRKKIILERGSKCQTCGKSFNLEVHHNCYENLGEELSNDLIVLCRDCHQLFHDNKRIK